MPLTKFDVVVGLEREIARLTEEWKNLESGKYIVQESDSTDITRKLRDNIAECATELDRLRDALNALHVS